MRILVQIRIGVVVEANDTEAAMGQVESWGNAECHQFNKAIGGYEAAVIDVSGAGVPEDQTNQQALDSLV